MQVRKGGAWRSTTSAQAYVNGAWRQIVNGKCFFNGAWRDVCNYTAAPPTPTPTPTPTPAFSVGVSASSVSVSAPSSNLTTPSVGVTPIGGRAPYSYSWTIISSDSNAAYSLNSPSSASTTVTASGLATRGECTIRCTCNDSTGLSATTARIDCTFFNSSTS